MIDKPNIFISCICLLLATVSAAPSLSSEEINPPQPTNRSPMSSEVEYASTPLSRSPPMSTLPMTAEEAKALATTPTSRVNMKSKLLANPSTSMKPRKNKNDLFFCCTDDNQESATETVRRSKERERNTKPPVQKRGKYPESEEPFFEPRPALLLRFFPDGTAVLISKFQLHLHVKPKQINFDPEDDPKIDDTLDYDPSLLSNNGKSFEVTYQRLEAIPTEREQNLDELPEEDTSNAVSDVYDEGSDDHRDHELVTLSDSSTTSPETKNNSARPSPLLDSTEQPEITTLIPDPKENIDTLHVGEININKREKVTSTIGDSPFFIMTSGEMSALQHQYEPAQAAALQATPSPQSEAQTTSSPTVTAPTTQTEAVPTTTMPVSSEEATETAVISTEPSTATTKCLSFRNQLSLALSTEDNIGNSLLKKHILPIEDCNDTKEVETFAKLESLEPTSTEPMTTVTTQPTTIPTTQAPTTPFNEGNNIVSYLSSRLTNNPSKSSEAVVVTSLPVLIDLKNNRNKAVTDGPAWREVTVGVVRDQQGHPLKPRYNNWTAHLRSLKKRPGNSEFWNELTTPKPIFDNHHRLPAHQNIQQSPSHVHQAFWTDLQRQRPPADQPPRNRQTVNSEQYNMNPPRNYHAPNVNDYHWRSSAYNSNNNRWNANIPETFHPSEDVRRMKRPSGSHRNVDNQETRQVPQWNHGNPRRW